MKYVDGYVLPVPVAKLEQYRSLARKAAKIWLEHGALEYCEAAGDDLDIDCMVSFRAAAGAKEDETVVFAWIVYKSRAHRDRVNKKVMEDPRLTGMKPKDMPFECGRMVYGGFKAIVEAGVS
jgi:uncharacterized protein YbaA (DUF1428 family)